MSTEDEKLLKEAKKLPWDERLQHKNWKVRNDANIDLAALCDSIADPKDARLREFGPLFKKTVADSNAPVQEKALDALLAFQRAADADASRYAKEVCDAIVAKCLTGRPKTVEKAQAAFLLWVELEAAEVFLESMEKAVKNKVAKAVVPAIDVMFQAISEFGTKVVPPKKILKMLPELFDHPDQNVRASSKGLTLELCRWIGKEPVKSILFEKMRDTMKKELEAELANVSGIAKPTRKIRYPFNNIIIMPFVMKKYFWYNQGSDCRTTILHNHLKCQIKKLLVVLFIFECRCLLCESVDRLQLVC
jgi:cytoskeleton-associated protein 5